METKKNYYCTSKECSSIFCSSSLHPQHPNQLKKIPDELSNEFSFKKKLGAGSNGVVFQIYDESDETYKALKLIEAEDPEQMKKELKILLKLHHQFIIRYFRSGILKKSKVYIIMEECDMSLDEYLKINKSKLTYKMKLKLFLEICEGIEYFHHNKNEKIIHRDLKPGNILMVENTARISDFGESNIKENNSKSTILRGTMAYLSPELHSLDENAKVTASPSQDIWSLGIIAHQMFADGQHPFKIPNSSSSLIKNIMDGKFFIDTNFIPQNSPVTLAIKGCLEYDPNKRLDIQDILKLFSSNKILEASGMNPGLEEQKYFSSQQGKKMNEVEKIETNNSRVENRKDSNYVHLQKPENESNNTNNPMQTNNILTPDRQEEYEERLKQKNTNLYLNGFHLGKGRLENVQLLVQCLENNKTINFLSLWDNDLGSGDPQNIELLAKTLQKNKTITHLDLWYNNLGSGNPLNIEILGKAIRKNKSITCLCLWQNNLGLGNPKNIEILAKGLKENKTITSLDFRWNNLGSKNLDLLTEALIENKIITRLDLRCNENMLEKYYPFISFLGAENTFQTWREIKMAKSTENVHYNVLTSDKQEEYEQILNYNDSQTNLRLNGFQLGKGRLENIKLLEHYLRNTNMVNSLSLGDNNLGSGNPENIKLLAKIINENKSINSLDLRCNNLGLGNPKNIKLLAKALRKNKAITYLDLWYNNLGPGNTQNVEILGKMIKKNKTITCLCLWYNDLGSGNHNNLEILAKALKENNAIRNLDFRWNSLGSKELDLLTNAQIENKRITNLDLSCNDF